MRASLIVRLLGLFLLLFSLTLIPPILVSLLYSDGEFVDFIVSAGLIGLCGALLWFPVRTQRGNLRPREAFVVVSLFWVVLGLLATLARVEARAAWAGPAAVGAIVTIPVTWILVRMAWGKPTQNN